MRAACFLSPLRFYFVVSSGIEPEPRAYLAQISGYKSDGSP